MKKLLSIILAAVTALSTACFTASAADIPDEVDVAFTPTQSIIEVEPGQKKVEISYNYTKNNGWFAMIWDITADADVISFNNVDDDGVVDPDSYEYVAYRILEKNKYEEKVGLIVTPNLVGIKGYNGSGELPENVSRVLIESPSVTANDTTAAGKAFMSFYINIAEDATPGDYTFAVAGRKGGGKWSINVADEELELQIDPVTIRVKSDALSTEGVQVRIPVKDGDTVTKQGLRFISTIDKDLYDIVSKPSSSSDTDLGFGTVVFPTKLLEEGDELTKETTKNGKSAKVVPAVKLYKSPTATDDEYLYTACMTGISKTAAAYQMQYTVRTYATYMKNGKKVTVYGEPYSTSVFAVALAAVQSGNESQYVSEYLYNHVLRVVDPDTYSDVNSWSGVYKP